MITSVLDSTVNFTEPWITWKQSLNWVIVSTMLVCGHVSEKLSWLLIGRGGPSPLLVVLFIGQEVLSCIQKLAEHEPREISKQHSSMVPALSSWPNFHQWWIVNWKCRPTVSSHITLRVVFITGTEKKPEQLMFIEWLSDTKLCSRCFYVYIL